MIRQQGITMPEPMFGTFAAGRYVFFVQGPPLSQSVPSGVYPLRPAVGGKTFVVDGGDRHFDVTSSPPHITTTHMFLGFALGVQPSGAGGQLELRQTEGAFNRFIQRVSKEKHPKVTIRWWEK